MGLDTIDVNNNYVDYTVNVYWTYHKSGVGGLQRLYLALHGGNRKPIFNHYFQHTCPEKQSYWYRMQGYLYSLYLRIAHMCTILIIIIGLIAQQSLFNTHYIMIPGYIHVWWIVPIMCMKRSYKIWSGNNGMHLVLFLIYFGTCFQTNSNEQLLLHRHRLSLQPLYCAYL